MVGSTGTVNQNSLSHLDKTLLSKLSSTFRKKGLYLRAKINKNNGMDRVSIYRNGYDTGKREEKCNNQCMFYSLAIPVYFL